MTVNQCNNAANGGGSLVICSANIVNQNATAPPTSTMDEASIPSGTPSLLLPAGLSFLVALWLSLVYIDRRRRSNA